MVLIWGRCLDNLIVRVNFIYFINFFSCCYKKMYVDFWGKFIKERIKCYFFESLNFIIWVFSIYYLSLLFFFVNLVLSINLYIDEF